MKTPFISAKELQNITNEFPTPFHLYDEKGIREKARALNKAFAWNKGFIFCRKSYPNTSYLEDSTRGKLRGGLCDRSGTFDEPQARLY